MIIEQGTSNRLFTFNEHELAQHDVEIRKPLEDKIKELIKSKNEQENILLDKIIKLQKQLKQERQKVIAELEEWVDRSYTINITEHQKDILMKRIKQLTLHI